MNIQANSEYGIHNIDLSGYKFQRKNISDQIISIVGDYINNKSEAESNNQEYKKKPTISIEEQKVNDKVQKELNTINLKGIFALSSSHEALKLMNEMKNI